MLRKSLLFLFCIISFKVSFAQIVNDETAFFNNRYDKKLIVKNRTEKVQIKMYAINELYSIQNFYFDTLGLLSKETISDSTGKINAQFDFSYNLFGDLIYREKQDFELKNHDTTVFYKTYVDGLLVRESTNLLPVVNQYFYDSMKRRVKMISCFDQLKDCHDKKITLSTYDQNNKLIRLKELSFKSLNDTNGMVTSNREISYNKNGKILFDKELVDQENIINTGKGSISYIYDENDNIKEIKNENGVDTKLKYTPQGLLYSKELTIMSQGNITTVHDKYSYTFRK